MGAHIGLGAIPDIFFNLNANFFPKGFDILLGSILMESSNVGEFETLVWGRYEDVFSQVFEGLGGAFPLKMRVKCGWICGECHR